MTGPLTDRKSKDRRLSVSDSEELIARLRAAVGQLPEGLREHIARVEVEASRLAALHGLDQQRMKVAVLGHDLARAGPDERLLELARSYGVEAGGVELSQPILLHGPVAARMLRRDFGLTDSEVLRAVEIHTTSAPGMSTLQKVLFVADKIEPDKVARKPALAEVAALAETDIDAAMLRFLDLYFIEAAEKGWQVQIETTVARNRLLANRQRMASL
jgi:predicted HD superfamily hydrolase involved in NAD metabolism